MFADDTPAARAELTATANAQPAIFAVEYALAQTWIAHGIEPDSMIGHSVGEFVAATLAGVMSLEDALRVGPLDVQLDVYKRQWWFRRTTRTYTTFWIRTRSALR